MSATEGVGQWPTFLFFGAAFLPSRRNWGGPKGAPALRSKTSEGKAAEVERLIAPTLTAMGYDIVRIQLSGDQRPRLQIMAEHSDGSEMIVDNCAEISRTVSALLDVEDPIKGSYNLEVSSPGIDRPLTRLVDFDRFAGLEARVELSMPRDGRRRFRGRLKGTDEEEVRVELPEGEVRLPFDLIQRAKLVLTDELLAASAKKARNGHRSSD